MAVGRGERLRRWLRDETGTACEDPFGTDDGELVISRTVLPQNRHGSPPGNRQPRRESSFVSLPGAGAVGMLSGKTGVVGVRHGSAFACAQFQEPG